MRTLFLLLLAPAAAWAQQAPVVRTSVEMMPGLERQERQAVYRALYATMGKARGLPRKIAGIDGQLRGKIPPQQRRKLVAERNRLRQRLAAVHEALDQALAGAGLDPGQIERLKRMPRGALREERYNQGVVLEAPALSALQEDLLMRLVTAVNAAQRALLVQKNFVARSVPKEDLAMRRRLVSNFDYQSREMCKRFWRVAGYALEPDQMRTVKKLLSPRYAYLPEPQRQLYMLPGITPSQTSRIRALFTELESERTADSAEVKQNQAKLRAKGLSRQERQEIQRRNGEAYARLQTLQDGLRAAIREVLTEEQLNEFRTIPPMCNVGERYRPPERVLRGIAFRPEQARRVAALRQETVRYRRNLQKEVGPAYREMMEGGFGPESPQQMTMQSMRQGNAARMSIQMRSAGHEIVLEVLDPEQVVDWVVSPDTGQAGDKK